MDTVVTQLREKIADLQAQLATVQGERDTHATALEALPALQQTASMAEETKALNEKLNQVLRYPGLLSQTQVETKEVDGQQVETRTNPFLDAAMSSTLEGGAFTALLAQLEARIGAPQTPQAPPPASPLEMNVPPRPTPSPDTGSIAEIQRQIDEAHQEGRYQDVVELQDRLYNHPEFKL
jgi:hypothetical protein